MTLKKKHFENIVGKGENAGNQNFILFPQCFPKTNFKFSVTLFLCSAYAFNLNQSKKMSFGKWLKYFIKSCTYMTLNTVKCKRKRAK